MSSCDKTIMFTFNWIEVQQQQHQHLTVDQRWVERKKRVSIFSECFTHHFMDTAERCDRWMEIILSAQRKRERETIKVVLCLHNSTCVCTGQRSADLCSKKHKQQSLSIYLFMVIHMMLICVWCELRDEIKKEISSWRKRLAETLCLFFVFVCSVSMRERDEEMNEIILTRFVRCIVVCFALSLLSLRGDARR